MVDDLRRYRPEEFLKLTLEEDSKREEATSRSFAHELTLIDRALQIQLKGFQTYGEDTTGATFSVPIQLLLARLFNNQLAARKLILLGYITEAVSILARALETSWLTRYFDCYPERVEVWWRKRSDPRQLSPKTVRNGLKKAYDDGRIRIGDIEKENCKYQDLCEIGHPNYYGSILHSQLNSTSPVQIGLTLGGYPSFKKPHLIRGAFRDFLMVQMLAIVTMASVHNEFLDSDEEWDSEASSFIREVTKYFE